MKTSIVVEQVLRDSPDARNSDKVLMFKTWEKLGFYLSETQKEKFLNLPDPQTIGRIRRKLQEQGRYPATKEVKQTREVKSTVVQQNIPSANINTTERVLEEVPKQIPLM
jgi:hypothetical protein